MEGATNDAPNAQDQLLLPRHAEDQAGGATTGPVAMEGAADDGAAGKATGMQDSAGSTLGEAKQAGAGCDMPTAAAHIVLLPAGGAAPAPVLYGGFASAPRAAPASRHARRPSDSCLSNCGDDEPLGAEEEDMHDRGRHTHNPDVRLVAQVGLSLKQEGACARASFQGIEDGHRANCARVAF
jgi:hypothetical protein